MAFALMAQKMLAASYYRVKELRHADRTTLMSYGM
jgi:hypothetical protein